MQPKMLQSGIALFLYAQFPALDLSGDLLYQPFCKVVERIEKCGLHFNIKLLSLAINTRC